MEIREKGTRLTLDVEVVTVPDSGLEEDANRVGKLRVALITEGGEREVLVRFVTDGEVVDLSLREGVLFSGGLNHSFDLLLRLFLIIDHVLRRRRSAAVSHPIYLR